MFHISTPGAPPGPSPGVGIHPAAPLLAAVLLAATLPAQAIHRCVDGQGRTTFSDQPCPPDTQASTVEVPRSAPPPVSPAAAPPRAASRSPRPGSAEAAQAAATAAVQAARGAALPPLVAPAAPPADVPMTPEMRRAMVEAIDQALAGTARQQARERVEHEEAVQRLRARGGQEPILIGLEAARAERDAKIDQYLNTLRAEREYLLRQP